MDRKIGIWVIAIALTVVISVSGTAYYFGVGPFARGRTKLMVFTTTSLYDTGLLDAIEDEFEAKYPIDVCLVSKGTGVAIKYAQRGDADMILIHAPSEERAFLEDGYGVCRKIIAYNFFAIVGPKSDPAGINGSSTKEALNKIVAAGRRGAAKWISRGDNSGTHAKEKGLWNAAGINWTEIRDEGWYSESGVGMGQTLLEAKQFSAYTLADMGTYLKYKKDGKIDLEVLVEQEQDLLNVYSAIVCNKSRFPKANFEEAINFTKFLVSDEGQQIIGEYGQAYYNQGLFYPAVKLLKDNSDPTLVEWIQDYAFFDGYECPPQYRDGHPELYG